VKKRPRVWRPRPVSPRLAGELADKVGVSNVTAQILVNRGVQDAESADRFLHPKLSHLEEPSLMADIGAAAARIRAALGGRQRILIFGDYDVDGVTSSALLFRLLTLCGADCEVYLPSRLEEGYGLSAAATGEILRRAPDLVVTVDCGIGSAKETVALQAAGVDVIITDHHPVEGDLPPALAVVDPKRPDCPYPFKQLAGVGVSFKLAWEVARGLSRSKRVSPELRRFLLDSLGLVALGTVADVVPLVGENRVLVNYGLDVVASGRSAGLAALMDVSGLGGGGLTSRDVAFRLGPRLNAAGRTGRPDDAIELLLEEDAGRAGDLAAKLDRANRERQRIEERIVREAMACPEVADESRASIVLGSDGWHAGVVGIVASRLVERTGRPAVVVAFAADEGRGSARSVPGVDVGRAVEECRDVLVSQGGHAAAAGVTVRRDRLDEFREAFERAVRSQLGGEAPAPVLGLDAEVLPEELTLRLAQEIETLAPFGEGNPVPVLASRGFTLDGDMRPLGNGKHYQLSVACPPASGEAAAGGPGARLRAVAFGYGDRRRELEGLAWKSIDMAYEIQRSNWSGPAGFELSVKDLRAAGAGPAQ